MGLATEKVSGERESVLSAVMQAGFRPRIIDSGFLLPDPMPSETIRSYWERFHRMSRSNSVKETLEAMFGPGARLRAGHCLPSRLAELSRRVGSDHVLGDTRVAIERHTTLPFHCYFHTTHQREHAFDCLLGARGSASARATLGLAKSPVLLDKAWPAFCEDCVIDDSNRFGFAYWKTVHQLPPVAVCPWHGRRLREVRGKHTNWCGYGYLPPPDLSVQRVEEFPLVPIDAGVAIADLLQIAQACLHVQERPQGFPGDWRTKAVSALTLSGYKSKGGLDHVRVAKMMVDRHGEALLTWLGLMSAERPMSTKSLRGLLGFQRVRQPTILYIVLALAIAGTLPAFERISTNPSARATGETREHLASSNLAKLIAQVGDEKELAIQAASMGLDRLSARRGILLLCGRTSSRPEPVTSAEKQSVIDDAQAGATSKHLRDKYRLHLSDIFLILERDPSARRRMEQADFLSRREQHRHTALRFLRENVEHGRDHVRDLASRRFKMLQRYDIQWYEQHFPAPATAGRRIEAPDRMDEIDQKLSQQVARTIRILVDDEGFGSPTQADVISRCRATALFLRNREGLPRTVAVLAQLRA
jgi:hypothetical protein